MKKIGVTLIFLFFLQGYSLACECILELTETLKDKVDIASIIFYGEVVSIADLEVPQKVNHLNSSSSKRSGYEPTFRVLEVLKGSFGTKLKNGNFSYQGPIAICSDLYQVGEKYLVLANHNSEGEIRLRLCNPPFVFSDDESYEAMRKEIKKALRQNPS